MKTEIPNENHDKGTSKKEFVNDISFLRSTKDNVETLSAENNIINKQKMNENMSDDDANEIENNKNHYVSTNNLLILSIQQEYLVNHIFLEDKHSTGEMLKL